jgi:hypothetical protein
MDCRHFLAAPSVASLAGCTGLFGPEERSHLGLTVRNDRADPVTVQIAVVDSEGTTYEDDADQIDSGVACAFEVVVGTKGRHEVTVAGDDFRGQLAWDATICRLFDGQVSVTDDLVEVAGECVDQR